MNIPIQFVVYVSVPIAFMAYFGDPEWYNKHVYPLKDAFVKPEKAEVVSIQHSTYTVRLL